MWKAIDGYLGRYAVSESGEVLSMDFAATGLPGILKPIFRDKRYASVMLSDGAGKRRWHFVHALVASTFLGPRPANMQVNHKDGVRSNNAVSNLEYCTRSENMKHAHAIGLQSNRGEGHSQHKLSEGDVRKIHELLALGLTQKEIATAYGVTQSLISHIKAGRNWSHLTMAATGETPAAEVL